MKISTLALFVCLMVFSASYSQTPVPVIQYQKVFGTRGLDYGNSIVTGIDGGYVLAGTTKGMDDITNCSRGKDVITIIKLNNSGDTVWQKCLMNSEGVAFNKISMRNTPDGGFIVMGASGANWLPGYHGGRFDTYVAKLDRNGLVQWQRFYGGSEEDRGGDIIPVSGGGYVFLSETLSSDGDLPGVGYGRSDIWMVNIDELGNIRWQKRYGGAGEDLSSVIQQTSDGGYIFGGGISDVPSQGEQTNGYVYIVKLAADGSIIWQRKIDASYGSIATDIKQTADGGYVALNAPQPVVRINTDGTTRWIRAFSDSVPGAGSKLLIDSDGGFIMAGSIRVQPVNQPGDYGRTDGWIFKIKDQHDGEMVWSSMPLGGILYDSFSGLAFDKDGELLIIGTCRCDAAAYPVGLGYNDIWFVKTGKTNTIKGIVFIDNNLNGIRDAGDVDANNFLVRIEKGGIIRESITSNGRFQQITDTGTYTTSVRLTNSYVTAVPVSHQTVFSTHGNVDSFNLALQPLPGIRDYGIAIIPVDRLRPGFTISRKLQIHNDGSEILTNREVVFIKERMTFINSTLPPSSVNGDTLKWTIASLRQGETIDITIKLKVDAAVGIGDVIVLKAAIDSTGDINPSNNLAVLRQPATGSMDPNDKMENSGRYITRQDVENGKELTYTIRFQNTGTDTAFNVVIRDTLHANFNWNSLKIVAASHRFTFDITNGNKLSWKFDDIHLPDSNVNEQASHGFITYRIKAKNIVMPGDTLKNSASIYFDYNLPVQTNTHLTLVRLNLPDLATPSVQGIAASYCSSQGLQKGKVNNLPAAGSGISVSAKLDGHEILIATDSTFGFDVNTLSEGMHAIEVAFTKADATQISNINFRASVAVNPDVNVSANIITAVNLTDPVIINAINVAGGGRNPLYTFGKDRNFNTNWQAEGSSNVLSISPTALQNGDNWIYVRMKSSSACVTSQYNTDSIKITRQLPAPNQPLITGINNSYCINNGLQKAKLANYPAQGSGTVVTVKLNSNEIALAADTSFSFNVTTLGAGAHVIEITYTNLSGTKTTQVNFNVTAAVIPDVNITANTRNVSNVTDSIVITAFNAAGGGATPLFTFARNNTFTDILRAEATAAAIKIHSSAFKLGENWMYVRMKTSANCYTSQTATDSVLITRFGLKGLVDPDYPEQLITLAPNPYKSQVTVYGLSSAKSYTVKLYNLQGKMLQQSKVSNRTTATFRWPGYAAGNYMLSIFDDSKNRLIGSLNLLKQ